MLPPVKMVAQLAYQEAQRLGDAEVGTEHILVALLKCPGIAATILNAYGVNLTVVRACIAVAAIVDAAPPLAKE